MRPIPAAGPIQKEAIVKRMTVTLAVCTMFLATSIQAQAPQGPPKPGPELKKLDYNIGTWNVEGAAKPFGPMPGGKFTATEKCEWYSGVTRKAPGRWGQRRASPLLDMIRMRRFTRTMSSP